jgi:DNA-binding transcriptional LysR family regulator
MEIDDLIRYGVLAEELHFRRAAARLGISQPGLTRRIRRLEREFGAYLVERHSSRIRLTTAGEILAERAARFTREFARLKADIADAGHGIIGQLAVGFFTSLSSAIFLQVLRSFYSTESVRLDLREGTVRQQLLALRQQEIDLAIAVGPIHDPSFNTESLWSERLIVVAPSDHPFADASTLSWPDLASERLILRASEQDHWITDYVKDLAAIAGCRPNLTEFLTTRENMVGLVRAGFGIALLPESSLLSLNTDQLACITMSGVGTQMEIVGAWLPENANPVLRRFLEQITSAAKQDRRSTSSTTAPPTLSGPPAP